MMRLHRFIILIETHGADPARWPQCDAAAAAALLANSAEARAWLHEAAAVDAALAASAPVPDPAAWQRMRAGVAARIARLPLPEPAARPFFWLRPLSQVGCGALAMLALCLCWLAWSGGGSGGRIDLLAAPQPLLLAGGSL